MELEGSSSRCSGLCLGGGGGGGLMVVPDVEDTIGGRKSFWSAENTIAAVCMVTSPAPNESEIECSLVKCGGRACATPQTPHGRPSGTCTSPDQGLISAVTLALVHWHRGRAAASEWRRGAPRGSLGSETWPCPWKRRLNPAARTAYRFQVVGLKRTTDQHWKNRKHWT